MIYLDNAATTLQKPQAVYDAVYDAMKTLGNSGRGFSGAALRASRMIYEARQTLCDFFGGSDPSRLVFTSNATEALNMAIQGMFLPGDHVITTQLEHNSVLRPLYAMQKKGVELTIAASGQNGTVDFDRSSHPGKHESDRLHPCIESDRKPDGHAEDGRACKAAWAVSDRRCFADCRCDSD